MLYAKVFEVLFRSSTEKKKVTCPDCGGRDVAKKFSLFGTRTAGGPIARLSGRQFC